MSQDPDFVHALPSMITNSEHWPKVEVESWRLARSLGDPEQAVLFDQVRPEDVHQGFVGDCGLLAALSSLGRHPQKIKSLFDTQQLTEDGKYGVWLYDLQAKKWEKIIVDEYIPCCTVKGEVTPFSVRPTGEELWVMLLEKALAKWCGRYMALSFGDTMWYLAVLTGPKEMFRYIRKPGTQSWKKVKPRAESMKSRDCHDVKWRSASWGMTGQDSLYKKLRDAMADKHVVTCAISIQGQGMEAQLTQGLYNLHCYSMLRCFDEVLDNGKAIRFVQLRNPWGHGEWEGDWSDFGWGALSMGRLRSQRWQENPKLRDRLAVGLKDDGIFYMSFEDWANIYTWVDIVPVGGKPIPPDEDDEDGEDEPQSSGGFLSGWFGW